MRQVLPLLIDSIDPVELYRADSRPTPDDRPWVMVNMVASVGGATALDGVSGGLGGNGDAMVFRALRAVPDAILVAGGTARAENYGPPVARTDVMATREASGQAAVPLLAVVTGSADLDVDGRLFENDHRPLVYTTSSADPSRLERLRRHTDVIEHDGDRVDMAEVLHDLYRRGARVVLLEGGPSLNGEMAKLGLIDEWCLTSAPKIVAGSSKRMVSGDELTPPIDLTLDRVLEHEGELFFRYLSQRRTSE